MTTADRLTRAAEVLRERAGAATPGPWWSDPALAGVIFSGTGLGTDVAVTEDFDKEADSRYIALMHPPLALALADWLDAAARDEEAGPMRGDRYPRAVADLILEGDDDDR